MKGKWKLKPREVKGFRNKLLKQQGGICPLCGFKIQPGQETLDHCHESGRVRAVLHRNCNQVEGRIKSWCRRAGKHIDALQFLEAIAQHWAGQYDHLPLHPNHRTTIQKEIQKLKRRKQKLKTGKARKRYDKKIKYLQEQDNE